MAGKDADIYETADRGIQSMNRTSVREFGRLKLAKFDEVHIIREVTALYRKLKREAERQFYEIAFEAYLLGLAACGMTGQKAHQMAEKTIDDEWVQRFMTEPDYVTGYQFDAETDRKRDRLIETLAAVASMMVAGGDGDVSGGTDSRIDKAMRDWSRQFGQWAINVTDAARTEAFSDADVERAMWVTRKDERVCHECRELDGQVFELDLFPPKPHYGCRCGRVPVRE